MNGVASSSKMAVNEWHQWRRALAGSACLCLLACCQSQKPVGQGEGEGEVEGVDKPQPNVAKAGEEDSAADLGFLMTMTWDEARALSAQSLEVPPFFRLAADKIEVLKTHPDGRARRVRAKGKVFIEMQFADTGRVLCQEAFLSDDELILRGKPVLQRGGSAVSGLDDVTVFYMLGTRLKVIGRHRVLNEDALIAEALTAKSTVQGGGGFAALGAPPLLPVMSGPWAGGPNPLLPPLSAASVSDDVRQKMRLEAEAVPVMPLDRPQEEAMGPPVMAPEPKDNTKGKEPPPVKEGAPLLPVPVKSGQ